ncbi:MAG: phosphate transport regulator [Betaproteobacteria bacterium RIFCSPLOWO2_12_FULL_66_14]|nr:MAG: phosphate transport regulator [Betaproteobacteria bacterium RIFCSPLOWO2_12_FULL_66_14]
MIAFASPRSDNYFSLFNELAACTVRGAKVLARMSSVRDPAEFQKLFDEIKKTEGEADGVTRSIFLSLHKTFITPFDRWEIKDLAMALDDMIDYMEDIPQRAALYGPGDFTPEMAALGQIALRGTEKVQEAVALLADMKNAPRILQICQEIGEIESDGDRVMRAGMTRLFAETTDARALIRAKELYELFEEAVDRCEDAADVIHGVVLERI